MTAALLIGAFALGAALGAAHFLSLWGTVALMREGRTGLGLALQGLRFVAARGRARPHRAAGAEPLPRRGGRRARRARSS